jgi:hypothetical protein
MVAKALKSQWGRVTMLLKEHRFTFIVGAEIHLLKVEELVGGLAFWPHRFRLKLPATAQFEAKTIYGAECDQVAQVAADVIAGPVNDKSSAEVRRLSVVPVIPPQTLQIQEQQ